MSERMDTAEYLEELAATLASHGSNLAALRMAELEQRVSPSLPWPGVPSATAGSGGGLGGLATAYSPSVAVGGAGLFVTDGAITVTNPGSTVIIDGTSNMFKIVTTGTMTEEWPASAPDSAWHNVVVNDAAPGGVLPHLAISVAVADTAGAERFEGAMILATGAGAVQNEVDASWFLDGTDDVNVQLHVHACLSTWSPGTDAMCRFYIFKEVGI
jgi:hypothetical protein